MTLSLNEIDAICKRAARGSGLSWGLSEEAGKAARWLAGHNLPGPEALAGLLTLNDGINYRRLCPGDLPGTWQAAGGQLCPLITGAAICDLAAGFAQGREIRLGAVSYPMLLLPFVAAAASLSNTSIGISWDGVTASFGPDCRITAPDPAALTRSTTQSVQIGCTDATTGDPLIAFYRGKISPDAAATLGALGHRTYAPDTTESRLLGAGDGPAGNG